MKFEYHSSTGTLPCSVCPPPLTPSFNPTLSILDISLLHLSFNLVCGGLSFSHTGKSIVPIARRTIGAYMLVQFPSFVATCSRCMSDKRRKSSPNEGSLITVRLVARPPLTLSGSHLLCLFTCKSVQYKYYFDAVLSISVSNMSDYSGWMPSQIKIELRRRRVRATGGKPI